MRWLGRATLVLFAVAATGVLRAQEPQSSPPAFTDEQAMRGQATYRANCQDCHGSTLDNGEFGGPPLKGGYFDGHWGAANVAALYGFMSTTMPPDRPGRLTPQSYADLTAFVLSNNGYAGGDKELPTDGDAQQRMSLKK